MLAEEPGRSVSEVAESLGIGPDLIYRWGSELRWQGQIAFPGHGKPALTDEQRRIKELEKKLRDAEIERDILKKSLVHLQQSTELIFQLVHENRSSFSVKKMCHALRVSQSGYNARTVRAASRRAQETVLLRKRIAELYAEHGGVAGSPMITGGGRVDESFERSAVPRCTSYASMALRCRTNRKFVVTTDSTHSEPVASNILNRQFTAAAPNEVWETDITYLKVGRRWHFLTVFIDLYSRLVVGWDLSDSLERQAIIHVFQRAIVRRRPAAGLVVHSDRGIQYASTDFRARLKLNGCIQSMSRKGNCWDNAVAESFFHTLKIQFIWQHKFLTRYEVESALFQYIEAYYNRGRRHSSNGWMSPAEY